MYKLSNYPLKEILNMKRLPISISWRHLASLHENVLGLTPTVKVPASWQRTWGQPVGIAESLAELGDAFSRRGILSACVSLDMLPFMLWAPWGKGEEEEERGSKHRKCHTWSPQRDYQETKRFPDGGENQRLQQSKSQLCIDWCALFRGPSLSP